MSYKTSYVPGLDDHDPLAWMSPDARARFEEWKEDYQTVKERIRSKNVSSFWTKGFISERSKDDQLDRALKLSGLLRATSNFVRILTNDPSIKVYFSSGDMSYTDGKSVVISADTDVKSFDVITGTCLHEAAHCVRTPLTEISGIVGPTGGPWSIFSPVKILEEWLRDEAKQKFVDPLEVHQSLHTIMNAIEDRRIDRWVYDTAPGYRGYYDKLYEFHWNSTEIENRLLTGWTVPSWQSYIGRLINISNPYAQLTKHRLLGVSEMYDMVDLPNIRRWDDLPTEEIADNLISLSVEIFKWIFVCILKQKVDDKSNQNEITRGDTGDDLQDVLSHMLGDSDDLDEILKQIAEKDERTKSHLPNLDIATEPSVEVESDHSNDDEFKPPVDVKDQPQIGFNYSDVDLADQVDFTNNHGGHDGKKEINWVDQELVDVLNDSMTKISEASNQVTSFDPHGTPNVKILTVHRVTRSLIDSEAFTQYGVKRDIPWGHDRLYAEGRRWGMRMVRDLQVRNENTNEKFSRKTKGKLDRRLLAGLGYQNDQVFYDNRLAAYKPSFIHLSLDLSSSMYGEKWNQTFKLAVALGYASKKIDNLDVVITTRSDGGHPALITVFDSRKNSLKDLELIKHFYPDGCTPEGLVFGSILEGLESIPEEYTKFFINICDGVPYSFGEGWEYSGQRAISDTRRQYKMMKEMGVTVWSFYVADAKSEEFGYTSHEFEQFNEMYSPDATELVPNNVRKIIANLNTLLKGDSQKS